MSRKKINSAQINQSEKVHALRWWSDLNFETKKFYAPNTNPSSLTGREVHIIYKNKFRTSKRII